MARGSGAKTASSILYGDNPRIHNQVRKIDYPSGSTLEQMRQDGRFLGFGYLGASRSLSDPELMDHCVTQAAASLRFGYEHLFTWANSKLGRRCAEEAGNTELDSNATYNTFFRLAKDSMTKMVYDIRDGCFIDNEEETKQLRGLFSSIVIK